MGNKTNETALLISIKPKYLKKILDGEKTVELRKCMPSSVNPGNIILLYSTAPEMELKGFCEIDKIECTSPSKLWPDVHNKAGIKKKDFENYYNKTEIACAIYIKNIQKLISPVKLKKIKELFPDFTPPQTYRYIANEVISSISENQIVTSPLASEGFIPAKEYLRAAFI